MFESSRGTFGEILVIIRASAVGAVSKSLLCEYRNLGRSQMDVSQLPFNHYIGLELASQESGFLVSLPEDPKYTNHVGTVHASALLAVAEAGSAAFLSK